MKINPYIRLALKSDDDTFQEEMLDLCNYGWKLYTILRSEEGVVQEIIYLNPARTVSVHYNGDELLNLRYLFLHELNTNGNDRFDVKEKLSSRLDFYTEVEISRLISKLKKSSKLDIPTLNIVGISAPQEFSAEYMAVFEKALFSTEPPVQNAAITLTAYVGWLEFREPLEKLSESASNPEIKEYAEFMLDVLNKKNWNPDFVPETVNIKRNSPIKKTKLHKLKVNNYKRGLN